MCRTGCSELREQFRCNKFGLGHTKPWLFVSPQCGPSKIFIGWTVFWAIFYTVNLSLEGYYNPDKGAIYLTLLTHITYITQALFVFTDLAVTLYVHCGRKEILEGVVERTPWYMKIQWILFNVSNAASITITIMYYTFLNPKFNHGSINTHMLNSVYTIVNMLFCGKPVQILHAIYPMIYSACYVLFSLIWHWAGQDPIYSYLDWDKPGTASGFVIALTFAVLPVLHLILFALYTLRVWLSEKCDCGNHHNKSIL